MSLNKPKPIKGAQNAAGYIVTANDLMSGEVVYLAQDSIWSQQPQTAVIFDDAEAAQAKAAFKNKHHAAQIVGAYATPVKGDGRAVTFKEQLRAKGPSNYLHGKQQASIS